MVAGSVWEVVTVTGVADSDVESLKCDRGRRFYVCQLLSAGWMLSFRSVWEAESEVASPDVGSLKCDVSQRESL